MKIHSIVEVTAYAVNGDKLGTFVVPWLAVDNDAPKGVSPVIAFKEGKATLTGRELLGVFDSAYNFPWTEGCKAIVQKNLANKLTLVKQSKAKSVQQQSAFQQGKSTHKDIRVFHES